MKLKPLCRVETSRVRGVGALVVALPLATIRGPHATEGADEQTPVAVGSTLRCACLVVLDRRLLRRAAAAITVGPVLYGEHCIRRARPMDLELAYAWLGVQGPGMGQHAAAGLCCRYGCAWAGRREGNWLTQRGKVRIHPMARTRPTQ